MKISKRVRSHAARMCSIAACSGMNHGEPYDSRAFPRLDGPPSHELAWDAWDAAAERTRDDNRRTAAQVWAEAECLLREGWSP